MKCLFSTKTRVAEATKSKWRKSDERGIAQGRKALSQKIEQKSYLLVCNDLREETEGDGESVVRVRRLVTRGLERAGGSRMLGAGESAWPLRSPLLTRVLRVWVLLERRTVDSGGSSPAAAVGVPVPELRLSTCT